MPTAAPLSRDGCRYFTLFRGFLLRQPLPSIVRMNRFLSARSVLSELRELFKAFGDFLIGGNVIVHLSVMEFLIGNEVEISCTGQTEDDRFFFAVFLAAQSFIDCDFDCVTAFRCREDAFDTGELFRCGEYIGLFDGTASIRPSS